MTDCPLIKENEELKSETKSLNRTIEELRGQITQMLVDAKNNKTEYKPFIMPTEQN